MPGEKRASQRNRNFLGLRLTDGQFRRLKREARLRQEYPTALARVFVEEGLARAEAQREKD